MRGYFVLKKAYTMRLQEETQCRNPIKEKPNRHLRADRVEKRRDSKITKSPEEKEATYSSLESRGRPGSHAPLQDQVEKPPTNNPHKHPLCIRIMGSRIPKSLEKPLKVDKYNEKDIPTSMCNSTTTG